jgi:aspartyl-tRNA(Asn)/glutamyl-tRNA(Gln) amidotransferase subunit C
MKLSREEILNIAKLSRLHLNEEEIELYRDQLGSILGYIDKLQELNTDDVPELQSAVEMVNVFHEDVVDACDDGDKARAIENFSEKEGDLLKVQAVFSNRKE